MHDLNRIKELLAQQTKLSERYEELDTVLADFKALRKNQEFIPQSMSSSICTKLADIQRDQDIFLAGYKALEFCDTASSIASCKAELEDYEKYILEKSTYVDVINFVLSLKSDNAAAMNALNQHKVFAASYDCRTNSAAQCETDLKRYILLKKAYEERDPAKRLSEIIELSPLIDFPLVVALNTNALTTEKSSAPSYMETKSTVQERPAEKLMDPQPRKPAAESVPKQESAGNTAPDEDLFWQPTRSFSMPDFTVQQKPISNRPAPDEAPVPHQGIENGLNAELTQVLSRENAAASIAADVGHTASLSGAAAPGKTIPDPWGNIGIYNTDAVCYSVADENMQIFRCERPRKFSAADLQKELSLKAKNRFQKQCAIKDAYKYGATSPRMLAELIKEDRSLVEDACDTLVDSGYLKAFELNGSAFDRFERLYVLTASGRKIFTHPETASLLNLPAVEKPATPPFASHANAVLNRQMFLKTKKLMELYMPSRQFNVGSFILETNSFINFFPTTNGSGTYAYVSVFGNEVKNYLIFKVELQEMLPSLDTITVVGMNQRHAKALADWIGDSFAKDLTGKNLQYYSYEDDTYYSYPAGAPIRI